MKKSVLSGLIAGALTVGMGYPAHAAEAADDSTQTYETEAIVRDRTRTELLALW